MDGAFANPIHWVFALAVMLLLFGPSKIGDIGGALGRSVKEYKASVNEADVAPAERSGVISVSAPAEPRPSLPDYRP